MHVNKILNINAKFNLHECIKENGTCGPVVDIVFHFLFPQKISGTVCLRYINFKWSIEV